MENELICRPVMLPSNVEAPPPHLSTNIQSLKNYWYLYLVSDREIKINDKYINTFTDKIEKNDSNEEGIDDIYKKIEATTDKSLGLPLIPQSFVEEYAQKQGKIDKVKIHIRGEGYCLAGMPITEENEVVILTIKDSWNRDEIKVIGDAYDDHVKDQFIHHLPFDEWFDSKY